MLNNHNVDLQHKGITFLCGKDIQGSQEVMVFAFVGSWHATGEERKKTTYISFHCI